MCLIIESGIEKPLVAGQDIKCMKVVFKVFDSPEHFTYRPVYNYNPEFRYMIGEEAVEKIQTVNGLFTIIVNSGLHSFNHEFNGWKRFAVWLEKAKRSEDKNKTCYYFSNDKKVEIAVLECIIPKGSEYYEGQANCINRDKEEAGSYVSNRLLPVREIPRSEWENYRDSFLKLFKKFRQ